MVRLVAYLAAQLEVRLVLKKLGVSERSNFEGSALGCINKNLHFTVYRRELSVLFMFGLFGVHISKRRAQKKKK